MKVSKAFTSILIGVIFSSLLLPVIKTRAQYTWDDYHEYDVDIAPGLQNLADTSDIAIVETIGVTHWLNDIKAIKISDNPEIDDLDEPDILFVGLHHAREWISAEVPFYIAVNLVQNYATDPEVAALVDSCEIWVVPVLNADGYLWTWDHKNDLTRTGRYWRKNNRPLIDYVGYEAYGVDPDRNYDWHWYEDIEPGEIRDGSDNPDDDSYWGVFSLGPFSEAETIAMRDLLTDPQHNFEAVLSYHSYSQLILYPWGHTDAAADDAGLMHVLASEMSAIIEDINSMYYTPQQTIELYPVSGDFGDWVYGTLGIPAFTIELRPASADPWWEGFRLPTGEIEDTCEENWHAALYLINYVAARNSVLNGLAWLDNQQNTDGSWPYHTSKNVGITSMSALAFLNDGILNEDIEKALDWIIDQKNTDGSISAGGVGTRDVRVYDTSLAVLALVAGGNLGYTPTGANLDTVINDAIDFLVDAQCVGASIDGHTYVYDDKEYGGWGYPILDPEIKWADLSNTQFAVLALAAATTAGISTVPAVVWENAAIFTVRCLSDTRYNPRFTSGRNDGGFQYRPLWFSGSRGSMTGAGIWTLGLCKSVGIDSVTVDGVVVSLDDAIADGLTWLEDPEHSSYDENWPDMNQFVYYYLLSVAKGYVIVNEGYDWYRGMVAHLVSLQEHDGRWPLYYPLEEPDVMAAAQSILAIQTRMPPPSGVSTELYIILGSPANLYVTDPSGSSIGIDPKTGEVVNEIAGASFTSNLQQVVHIPSPLPGDYNIDVIATDTGPYTLTIEGIINNQVIFTETFSDTININTALECASTITRVIGPLTVITTPIELSSSRPSADANGPYSAVEGSEIVFDASGSTDSDADPLEYRWDFDSDGEWDTSWSSNPTASHTWNDEFTGTSRLEVFDGLLTDTDTATVTVTNSPPYVEAGTDQEVDEGDLVHLDPAAFTDAGTGDTHTATIDWGDGTVEPGIVAETDGSGTVGGSHTYADDSVYTVTVSVTDDDGGVGTDTLTVTVNNVAPTIDDLSMVQPNSQFILPLVHELDFSGSFSDPGTGDTHVALWDWGDGTTANGAVTEIDGSGTATGTHTYSNAGTYTVTLTVTDDDGGSSTETYQVEVVTAEDAKHDLNQYIQNLPDSAFKGNPNQRKKAFDNMFIAVDDMLADEEYNGAIQHLRNNIRTKADGHVDGSPKNDWIRDPTSQAEICQKIDDLIAYLYTYL